MPLLPLVAGGAEDEPGEQRPADDERRDERPRGDRSDEAAAEPVRVRASMTLPLCKVARVSLGRDRAYPRRVIPVTSHARPRALQYKATMTRTRACCSVALCVSARSAVARPSCAE